MAEEQPLSNASDNDIEQKINNSNEENFRAHKSENCMAKCRRYTFSMIHFIVMVFYTFYLLDLDGDTYRKLVLISCGCIYFFRVLITMHVMLQRRVAIEEVLGVALILYPILHFAFGFKYSIDINKSFQYVDILYIFLYVIGSFFNTFSEFQRKRFKKLPTSKGKLYTKGLFSLTRHPNYLGDSLLFLGWGLLTWKWWNIWACCFMSAGFLFYHIPDLEKYLKKRYTNQWNEYQNNVAPFIPFVHFPKYKL